MNRIFVWFALGICFASAISLPLILLGVDKNYIWPIALLCATIIVVVRPGGTVEKFMSMVVTYGIVFSVWCIGGTLLVIVLGIVFSNVRPPDSLIIIAAVGAFGVYREVEKNRKDDKHTASDEKNDSQK